MTKLPAILDPRNYLAMLCQGREDERDIGYVWFVQGCWRNWTALRQGAMPGFPDPIPVRRR